MILDEFCCGRCSAKETRHKCDREGFGKDFLVGEKHQVSQAWQDGVRTRTGISGGGVKICPDHFLRNEMTMNAEGWVRPRLMLGELVGSQEDSAHWHDAQ